jgi:hypothetical protein
MKRIFLAVVLMLGLACPVSSQWYTSKYGVKDINELSAEQLEQSLSQARLAKWGGITLIGLGSVVLVKGISDFNKSNELGGNAGEGYAYSAVISYALGGLMELAGVTMVHKNITKIQSIKKVLNQTQVGLSFSSFPAYRGYGCPENQNVPVVTLSVQF